MLFFLPFVVFYQSQEVFSKADHYFVGAIFLVDIYWHACFLFSFDSSTTQGIFIPSMTANTAGHSFCISLPPHVLCRPAA